ncbi:hypothetical protein [Lysobacter gummosus]|uniref:hypothetical protein n=1 Tax=Lysobacter gummosus TaxID=262324 RepID=UPI00362BBA1B
MREPDRHAPAAASSQQLHRQWPQLHPRRPGPHRSGRRRRGAAQTRSAPVLSAQASVPVRTWFGPSSRPALCRAFFIRGSPLCVSCARCRTSPSFGRFFEIRQPGGIDFQQPVQTQRFAGGGGEVFRALLREHIGDHRVAVLHDAVFVEEADPRGLARGCEVFEQIVELAVNRLVVASVGGHGGAIGRGHGSPQRRAR